VGYINVGIVELLDKTVKIDKPKNSWPAIDNVRNMKYTDWVYIPRIADMLQNEVYIPKDTKLTSRQVGKDIF
jgi:hypothetical protein